VYAANYGAEKVIAFEPNSASYETLLRNINTNGLNEKVSAKNLAVTDQAGERVKICTASSPYNTTEERPDDGKGEYVETTDLSQIIREVGTVDLLKLDCEGAEYRVLLQTSSETLSRISDIRMEYHLGRIDELTAFLGAHGFELVYHHPDAAISGIAWFSRSIGRTR